MKVAWPHSDEYGDMWKSAKWQDRLAAPRGILLGSLIGALIWVLCVWAWAKVARYF